MILGVVDRSRPGDTFKEELLQVAARNGRASVPATVWANRHLAFCVAPLQIDTLDETPQPFMNQDQTIVVAFQGKIYNTPEIERLLGLDHRYQRNGSGEALAHLYEKYQESFLDRVNGKFAFALWNERNQKLILGRDRLGIEPLFYFSDGKRFVFGSSLRAISATGWIEKQLNHEAVLQYLLYCYNPGDETFLRNVYKVPAGHLLSFHDSSVSLKRYWRLSFAETQVKTEAQYREEILGLIEDAIRIRLEPHRPPGIFLSGGTDSSTIVSLASKISREPLYTFSYRCEGRSYDESRYARFVAQRYGTEHTEISYRADDLSLISRAVEAMDEPFCDIGIEIATWLLGQAAQGRVSYVFTGEGGDEMFGGHPVYTADKVAAVVDRLPRALLHPVVRTLQRIPDSDQKRNMQVKVKRFAYSMSFPPELLSHRWRIYYTPQELQALCTADFIENCTLQNLFDPMFKYSRQADGNDQLSRSLYSDYHTLVDFYLRRLGLLRAHAVEIRLPLLDHRLTEYAARIPSGLKIRHLSDTKYIYKKILTTVLPDDILHNRPKMGHSIPMKNWLRDDKKVREWMFGTISDGSFKGRGFFRPGVIQRMIDEHGAKKHNHSHRLWGLTVLELWLRRFFEEAGYNTSML